MDLIDMLQQKKQAKPVMSDELKKEKEKEAIVNIMNYKSMPDKIAEAIEKETEGNIETVKTVGLVAILGQAAEECAELGQALLKLQRIMWGSNPTPVTEDEARANIVEEATDVALCLAVLKSAGVQVQNSHLMNQKLERWAKRIEEARR